MRTTDLLIWGIVIHLFCDWLLQNDWQARNKSSLLHPASYIHSGIHLLGLLLIFPWYASLIIAVIHLLIDTRKPLQWWREFFKQTRDHENATPWEKTMGLHVAIWSDQAAHISVLAIAALIVGGRV